MYTKAYKQYITGGWCSHLIHGGTFECEEPANKYWAFLQEAGDLRLEIVMVLPVCDAHVKSMRAALNNLTGWLGKDDWELVASNSDSWSLIEKSLDK